MLIIHFLSSSFKLYYCTTLIDSDVLRINKRIYLKDDNSKKSKGFLGFFDWLRITEYKIVGIRICYFEGQPYNQILKRFRYVSQAFENTCIEMLFNGGEYRLELSGDQDFANNFFYKSNEESYLFTFVLDNLTTEEIESLLPYCEILKEMDLIGG